MTHTLRGNRYRYQTVEALECAHWMIGAVVLGGTEVVGKEAIG